jgi:predicted metal-binding membrane protein
MVKVIHSTEHTTYEMDFVVVACRVGLIVTYRLSGSLQWSVVVEVCFTDCQEPKLQR